MVVLRKLIDQTDTAKEIYGTQFNLDELVNMERENSRNNRRVKNLRKKMFFKKNIRLLFLTHMGQIPTVLAIYKLGG